MDAMGVVDALIVNYVKIIRTKIIDFYKQMLNKKLNLLTQNNYYIRKYSKYLVLNICCILFYISGIFFQLST